MIHVPSTVNVVTLPKRTHNYCLILTFTNVTGLLAFPAVQSRTISTFVTYPPAPFASYFVLLKLYVQGSYEHLGDRVVLRRVIRI